MTGLSWGREWLSRVPPHPPKTTHTRTHAIFWIILCAQMSGVCHSAVPSPNPNNAAFHTATQGAHGPTTVWNTHIHIQTYMCTLHVGLGLTLVDYT